MDLKAFFWEFNLLRLYDSCSDTSQRYQHPDPSETSPLVNDRQATNFSLDLLRKPETLVILFSTSTTTMIDSVQLSTAPLELAIVQLQTEHATFDRHTQAELARNLKRVLAAEAEVGQSQTRYLVEQELATVAEYAKKPDVVELVRGLAGMSEEIKAVGRGTSTVQEICALPLFSRLVQDSIYSILCALTMRTRSQIASSSLRPRCRSELND